MKVSHNFNVLFHLTRFWSTALKSFIIPWGILTPAVLNVAAFLGVPAGRCDVHADPNIDGADSKYSFASAFTNLLACNAKSSGEVTEVEHYSFLMYFCNKYFCSTKSFEVVKELSPIIHLMLSGRDYTWYPFFLALLYKGMEVF